MGSIVNLREHKKPFGVAMSGAEFSPWNGQTFPTSADWAYVSSKGITFAYLAIAWESLQTSFNGSLNSTYLANIENAISTAWSHGISIILKLQNFGCYVNNQTYWNNYNATYTFGYAGNAGEVTTYVNIMGDGTLTTSAFANLWSHIATALVGTSGLIGYGLMNEPTAAISGTNLLITPNYFSGPNTSWYSINSSALFQLIGDLNPLGSGYGPPWSITSGTAFGNVGQEITFSNVPYVLSCYAQVPNGTYTINLEIAGTSISSQPTVTTTWQRFAFSNTPSAGSNAIYIGPGGSSANRLIYIANSQLELQQATATVAISNSTPGVITWTAHGFTANQQVFFTSTSSLPTGLTQNLVYFVVGSSITTNTFEVSATSNGAAINTSSAGSGTQTGIALAAYQPSTYLPYAQAAITAIRAVDSSTVIYVCSTEGDGANFCTTSYEYATLTGTNLIFEGHFYFDAAQGIGGGGTYSGNYSSYGINNFTGMQMLLGGANYAQGFAAFLQQNGAKTGLIGELGIPNNTTDGNTNWITVLQLFLEAAWQNRLSATFWFYGNNGIQPLPGNPLNIAPLSVTISSGSYTSGTGAVSLTVSSTLYNMVGSTFTITNMVGTGSYSSLNGFWTAISGSTGTTLNFIASTGLTLTIGSGGNIVADDLRLVTMLAIP